MQLTVIKRNLPVFKNTIQRNPHFWVLNLSSICHVIKMCNVSLRFTVGVKWTVDWKFSTYTILFFVLSVNTRVQWSSTNRNYYFIPFNHSSLRLPNHNWSIQYTRIHLHVHHPGRLITHTCTWLSISNVLVINIIKDTSCPFMFCTKAI